MEGPFPTEMLRLIVNIAFETKYIADEVRMGQQAVLLWVPNFFDDSDWKQFTTSFHLLPFHFLFQVLNENTRSPAWSAAVPCAWWLR